jgi:phospholipase/carboxylesterase
MLNGASAAMRIVGQFILEQMKRFSLSVKQTAILGFSQGCVMAVHTGINMKQNPRALLVILDF